MLKRWQKFSYILIGVPLAIEIGFKMRFFGTLVPETCHL